MDTLNSFIENNKTLHQRTILAYGWSNRHGLYVVLDSFDVVKLGVKNRNFESIRGALTSFSRRVQSAPDLTRAIVVLSQPTLIQKIISVSDRFKLKISHQLSAV